MHADPFIKFPLKSRFEQVTRELSRLTRLMSDWETLINTGMDIQEAEEVLGMLESKYLTLENFNHGR